MVVEILFNDVAGPAKHERNIRTGADRQPNISFGCIGLKSWVN